MDSESPEQAPSRSHSSVQSNVQTKTDIGWDYATLVVDANGKKSCICNFCNKVISGGGINRVKKHLAGYKGEVVACPKVPSDVRFTIQGNLKETAQKDKDESRFTISDEDEDMEETLRRNVKARSVKAGKRKATSNVHPFFSKSVNDGAQPTIKSAMQSKAKLHDVDLAIAMFFYDACVPTNACNSPYYQHMVDKIAGIGHGYKAPNYHALRVKLLGDAKKSVSLLIDSFRDQWVETGCTIMSHGWRDIRQRHLINFLVYCPKGISFLKSVDASDISSDATNLCNLFAEIVEMVGRNNVVQLVTDNAANYKLADVSELDNVKSLVTLASRVTVFIYNHKWPLIWLRKRPGWIEIIRPGATRFGTAFIALQSLYNHKEDLQAMVISSEYKKMLKVGNVVECRDIVMNENFWKNSLITVKVMTPLLKLLRLLDSDEKPAIGYVYEGMRRARKGVKELFKKKKELFKKNKELYKELYKA
ncbi:hypothetical protein LXL04_034707 [Taraxacum kok-saghyz]